MAISYIVIPFARGEKGKLTSGSPTTFKSQDRAIASAERIAAHKAGAVVIEQDAEPKNNVYGEPKLVAHFGSVPPGMLEELAA
jgi:hypothetical protein